MPVGFCSVMVMVLVPPAAIGEVENALRIPIACTFRLAEAAEALVTPCWVWMDPGPGPAGMVLV